MIRAFALFIQTAVCIFALSHTAFAYAPGQAIDMTKLGEYTIDDIKSYKAMVGISVPTTSSVTTYKLRYYTTNLQGRLVIASAGVAVPNDTPINERPLLSYQHGTTTARDEAPSSLKENELMLVGGLFASNGYLVVAADYLGLGDDLELHPYLHAKTEASACADAILALQSLALTGSRELFLTGYSQGGHATMALHRYWQNKYGATYPVTAAAPMAGPYDLSGSVAGTARQAQKISRSSVMYTAYLVISMNTIYNLYPSLSQVVQEPYATQLPELFNGTEGNQQIAKQLPAGLADLLQPAFIMAIYNGTQTTFLGALKNNDVYDWKPAAPVQFCQGDADLDVPPANTVTAMNRMKALGANVTRATIPTGLNHQSAAMPCFKKTAAYFERFR